MLDFGAWVNEEYAVPADEPAPSLEEEDRNAEPSGEDANRAGGPQ